MKGILETVIKNWRLCSHMCEPHLSCHTGTNKQFYYKMDR